MTKRRCSKAFCFISVFILIHCTITGIYGYASPHNDAVAGEIRHVEYDFWSNIAKTAAASSMGLLENETGRKGNRPDLIVLTNAGYAMIDGHTTQACLDGLQKKAHVSTGRKTLLSVHSACNTPLWFFFMEQASGNGIYCEIDADALNLDNFTHQKRLLSTQVLKNVKCENLFADLPRANEDIFISKAFNGNEFRIVSLANLLLRDAPYDLIRTAQYHDHYCPGVTSGYFLSRYLQDHFPLNDDYGNYFILSMPPWCKDDALITMLNATPGKRSYGVFHLNSEDKAGLREDAQDIALACFRWNGDGKNPEGEGIVLSFDFTEAKQENNWGEATDWNWWESRLKVDLWYMDHLDDAKNFVKPIPIKGKERFSFQDLDGIAQPTDLCRPGVNPIEILELTNN